MADGLCLQGTGLIKEIDSSVQNIHNLISVNKTLSVSVTECVSDKKDAYLQCIAEQSGVMNAECNSVKHVDINNFKELQQEVDDCRKKRCSDRYDSSESSDSGVAALSCTDSSTASSDIADPGSPYSPGSSSSSSGCEDQQTNNNQICTPFALLNNQPSVQMAPVPTNQQPNSETIWPWDEKEFPKTQSSKTSTNLKRLSDQDDCHPKRLKTDSAIKSDNLISTDVEKSFKISGTEQQKQNTRAARHYCSVRLQKQPAKNIADNNAPRLQNELANDKNIKNNKSIDKNSTSRIQKTVNLTEIKQQVKITEYFKSQMKQSSNIKKTINLNAQPDMTISNSKLNQYLTMFSKAGYTKVSNEKPPKIFQNMCEVDVRTLTMTPPLKKERKTKVNTAASRRSALNVKKPINIAPREIKRNTTPIAPKTAETKIPEVPIAVGNSPGGAQLGKTVVAMPQATVLLTAIRMPPNQQHQQHNSVLKPGSPQKIQGPVIQLPVMQNINGTMMQIPNLMKLPQNLIVNPQMRFSNSPQMLLNGSFIKLNQNLVDGNNSNGNIIHQVISKPVMRSNNVTIPNLTMTQCQASFNTGVRTISVSQFNPVFMSPGIFINTTLPTVLSQNINNLAISSQINTQLNAQLNTQTRTTHIQAITNQHQYNVIQTASTPVPTPTSTPVPTPMLAQTPVPPPIKSNLVSSAATKTLVAANELPFNYSNNNNNNEQSIQINIETEIPTINVIAPKTIDKPIPSLIDINLLKSPTEMSPKSPKSLILERIQQKKPRILDFSDSNNKISDNCLSVSVNLSSDFLNQAQKSPILSQPKTIRFPATHQEKIGRRTDAGNVGQCFWDKCTEHFDTSSGLLEHLQTLHVTPQAGPYACLWNGCKVHARESCSRRWLERHVLAHGGTKPLKCIVGGCGCRFSSQLALQRHVNSHFNAESTTGSAKKSQEIPGVPKLIRRNGKRLRYRRQPWSARMFDFFDAGVMEGLQYRLLQTKEIVDGPNGGVTLTSTEIARRTSPEGLTQVLLSWSPPDIIQNEWVNEKEVKKQKVVNIRRLPAPVVSSISEMLTPPKQTTKHRRKPVKC